MKNSEIAVNTFSNGFNCSQSVLSTYAKYFNLSQELAFKIACGFGAGFGREQEVCGAVSGAIMVLGLEFGKSKIHEKALKEKTYVLVRELISNFKKMHQTINCKELLKCDLNTEDGKKKFHKEKLETVVCEKCVKDAVEILDKMLNYKYGEDVF